MSQPLPTYLLVAPFYALFSCLYGFCPRLRREPAFHLATVVLSGIATVLAVWGATTEVLSMPYVHVGTRFFLFLTASLCYVPAFIFLGLYYWSVVIDRLLAPGAERTKEPKTESQRDRVRRVRSYLEILSKNPSNAAVRERLANLYARMGFLDSAVYEYRKTTEWLPRGYAHAAVLYKAARILVEKKASTRKAVPLLRRIVRLYPKSYFAAYARRVLNQYEAHQAAKKEGRKEEREESEQ